MKMFLTLICFSIFFVSCDNSKETIKRVKLGMDKKEVIGIMGYPKRSILFAHEKNHADEDSIYLYSQGALSSESMRIHINAESGKVTRIIPNP